MTTGESTPSRGVSRVPAQSPPSIFISTPVYVPPPPPPPPPGGYAPLPPLTTVRATATVPVPASPGGPPPPWAAPSWPGLAAPPPRATPGRWLVVVVCILVMVAFGSVGAVVAVADVVGVGRTSVAWQIPPVQAPAANAPASEWSAWARRSMDSALKEQSDGLLAGDQDRFLAPVDPANTELVAALSRRFRVLSEMGVGQWSQAVRAAPKATGERTWSADVKITYCFGDPTCRGVALVVASSWEYRNDQLMLVALASSDGDQMGPRPWENDDLAVGVGDRVIVAATESNRGRVRDAVIAADRAAKVADSLARWDAPPSRYVIFLAAPTDWQRWYGHEQPEWAAAWAVPVSNAVTEVVVRYQAVQRGGLEQLLTHELTHVTTLAGERDGANRNAWWLIEGVADYATMIDRTIGEYDALASTRTFVRARWDGNPAIDPPAVDASLDEAAARYGVAFLAVRRIAAVYGEQKMLDFWGAVVHDNQTAENASARILGADWASVKADCAQYVRAAVG